MRVIAGKLKGKKLLTPANDNVRPTLDRIKETLFNIIQFDVADCVFLDLFAGTGGIGIEAYSRGAKEVVFCDASRESLKLIKANLKNLNIDAFVYEGDFKRFLKSQPPEKYGIIFIDPPYASGFAASALEIIAEKKLLSEGGLAIVEHESEDEISAPCGLVKQKTKKMGRVSMSFYVREG